jgi:23S rRNA pseudouridine2605 synthase
MRLNRYLSLAGVCSRREADRLIQQGRVSVNGQVVLSLGVRVDSATDRISLDGRQVILPEKSAYYLLHKPPGYLTTFSDPQGRRTIMDLIEGVSERVVPVGRLDLDAEGLLVLTNDGELAHRLAHPRFGIIKRYRVWVKGEPSRSTLASLRNGVELEDGQARPDNVQLIRRTRRGTVLELELHEGKKREVKRICAAIGHPVERLVRTVFGPLELGSLPRGAYRPLTDEEVRALRRAVSL